MRSRPVVAVLTVAAGAVFVTLLVYSLYYAPDKEVAVPALAAQAPGREVAAGELPVRLRIPRIEVNAHVKHVGINIEGKMATPGNFVDVGWYKYGTVPGFPGSAVMDGHVDNALSLPGVFKRLEELRPGDELFVDTASSTHLRFVVERVVSYPLEHIPLEEIFNAKGEARLNLITCEGSWLKDKNSYDHRLVVFAQLR